MHNNEQMIKTEQDSKVEEPHLPVWNFPILRNRFVKSETGFTNSSKPVWRRFRTKMADSDSYTVSAACVAYTQRPTNALVTQRCSYVKPLSVNCSLSATTDIQEAVVARFATS